MTNNETHTAETETIESQTESSVDTIFREADEKMQASWEKGMRVKQKRKRKRLTFLQKLVLSLIVTAILLVAGLIAGGHYLKGYINQQYALIKEQVIAGFSEARETAMNIKDDELTPEGIFQKELLLLLTEDELENIINNLEIKSIQDFDKWMKPGELEESLIPEEKKEQYWQIVEKYEQAMAKSDGQSPTSTEKEKGNESS